MIMVSFMMKAFGTIFVLLLATAVGLTLYLPKYESTDSVIEPFQVNKASLANAVDARQVLPSYALSVDSDDSTLQYALQLGLFGTLETAKSTARQLNTKNIDFPKSPTIVKLIDDKRHWYMLSVGPFASKDESESFRQALLMEGVTAQSRLWSAELDAQ